MVSVQNEVAKLTVDVLNTEAHNVRLEDTLQLLDSELVQKAQVRTRAYTSNLLPSGLHRSAEPTCRLVRRWPRSTRPRCGSATTRLRRRRALSTC